MILTFFEKMENADVEMDAKSNLRQIYTWHCYYFESFKTHLSSSSQNVVKRTQNVFFQIFSGGFKKPKFMLNQIIETVFLIHPGKLSAKNLVDL